MGVLANGEDRRGDELELNELELDAAVRQLTLIEERAGRPTGHWVYHLFQLRSDRYWKVDV